MKNTQIEKVENVADKIFNIRGQRVMIDSDLAEVYQVETKRLNEQVKRNLSRFPEDFMFQLTEEEVANLKSQFATSKSQHGGRRTLPYVFTEHGAVMLASVLNSPTAIEASIKVVRAFVQMRSILALHQDLSDRMAELEKNTDIHSKNFVVIDELLGEIFRNPKFMKRKIGFVEEEKKND
jgi:ORF6N domain